MHGIGFLQDLAVVMMVAGLVTLLFRRLRQPVILGYLLAGFIIGPFTPPYALVQDEATIKILADVGVVFLMFALGLDFSFKKLHAVGVPALVTAAFEIMFMTAVGYELGGLLGWTGMERLFLGIMLSLTSSTIVIKSLRDAGQLRERHGVLISGVSIFDDIFVIFVMILLPGFAQSGELPAGALVLHLGQLTIFLIAAVVVGLLVVPHLVRYAARFGSDEMLLIVVLALCFGVSLLTVRMGYSAALGAFLIGAILAETRELGRINRLVEPLRDMFSAVFFVAIGMLLDPRHLTEFAVPVLIITPLYVLAKVGSCSFGAFMAGHEPRVAMRVGTGLAQLGEFAFILATLGLAMGVIGDHLYPIVVAVAVLNALIRPYLVENSDRLTSAVARLLPAPVKTVLTLYSQWVGQLGQRRKTNPASRFVRSLIWQILLNLALVAATFIAAAFVARQWTDLLTWIPAWLGGWPTACWLAAVVVMLPVYVATVRKMQALAMLLGEVAVTGHHGNRMVVLRTILSRTMFFAFMVALSLLSWLLSLPLLPPLHMLVILAVCLVLALIFFGTSFNAWYSRAKFSLVETWTQPPPDPAHEPVPLPALLRDASLETIVLSSSSACAGRLVRELELRARTGASIVAIERAGKTLVNPGPDDEVRAGDQLLILGSRSQLAAARPLLTTGGDHLTR
jgi:CPA2 family monovalent cation:H+ antiporter-2